MWHMQLKLIAPTNNNLPFTKNIAFYAHELRNQFYLHAAQGSPLKQMYVSARQFSYTERRKFILQIAEHVLVFGRLSQF